MDEPDIINTGVCNYYGEVYFQERDGKFFMGLENYDGVNESQISRAFYEAAKFEFTADAPSIESERH